MTKFRSKVFVSAAVLVSSLAALADGACRLGTRPGVQNPQQVFVSCESIRELQRDERGVAVSKIRTGLMNASTPVRTLAIRFKKTNGRLDALDAPLAAPKTIAQLKGLQGRELFAVFGDLFGEDRLAEIDVNSVRIESLGIDDHIDQLLPSRCSYVSSEVRNVNLLRFLPNPLTCTSVGSCLPNKIQICSARIACVADPQFGSVDYATTCKADNGKCPSVDECIRDDSVTTPEEERREEERRQSAAAAGA